MVGHFSFWIIDQSTTQSSGRLKRYNKSGLTSTCLADFRGFQCHLYLRILQDCLLLWKAIHPLYISCVYDNRYRRNVTPYSRLGSCKRLRVLQYPASTDRSDYRSGALYPFNLFCLEKSEQKVWSNRSVTCCFNSSSSRERQVSPHPAHAENSFRYLGKTSYRKAKALMRKRAPKLLRWWSPNIASFICSFAFLHLPFLHRLFVLP